MRETKEIPENSFAFALIYVANNFYKGSNNFQEIELQFHIDL